MAAPSTSVIVTVAVASLATYLAYFDYRRRHSPDFRKQLRKSVKQHEKEQKQAAEASQAEFIKKIHSVLQASLIQDPLPTELKEQEAAFVSEVGKADELAKSNDLAVQIQAALGFYRALSIYPNPSDLLGIFDKTLKKSVLDILKIMIVAEPPANITGAWAAAPGTAEDDVE